MFIAALFIIAKMQKPLIMDIIKVDYIKKMQYIIQ